MKRVILRDPPLCTCGCGKPVTWSQNYPGWSRFISGHNSVGKNNSFYGKHHKQESKVKIGAGQLGRIKTPEECEHHRKVMTGKVQPQTVRDKKSKALKGKPKTATAIRNMQLALLEYYKTHVSKNKGRHQSAEARRNIVKSWVISWKNRIRENASNWRGGISFEPYPKEWRDELKKQIKQRDGNKCKMPCCNSRSNLLHVHHIDYDKKNLCPNNLITLCNKCHAKTNGNRLYYISLFAKLRETL